MISVLLQGFVITCTPDLVTCDLLLILGWQGDSTAAGPCIVTDGNGPQSHKGYKEPPELLLPIPEYQKLDRIKNKGFPTTYHLSMLPFTVIHREQERMCQV